MRLASLPAYLSSRWVARAAGAIVAIIIVWEVVSFISPAQAPARAPFTASVATSAGIAQGKQPWRHADSIVGSHLFGKSIAGNAGVPIKDAPDTKLELILHGIFLSEKEQPSFAIILSKGKRERHFAVGDSIYGLATLQEIHVDRVILSRKGHSEILRLPQKRALIEVTEEVPAGSRAAKDNELPRLDEFEYYVVLSPKPDIESNDGKLIGYSIEPANEVGALWMSKLGLEIGDIIVAVDGDALNSETRYVLLDIALAADDEVAVTIDRGGAMFPATLVAPHPSTP